MEFLEFDIEYQSSCVWDYLEIYESYQSDVNDQNNLGRLCGQNTIQPIETSSSSVTIIFHSDHIIPKKGFKLFIDCLGKILSTEVSHHLTRAFTARTYKYMYDGSKCSDKNFKAM